MTQRPFSIKSLPNGLLWLFKAKITRLEGDFVNLRLGAERMARIAVLSYFECACKFISRSEQWFTV